MAENQENQQFIKENPLQNSQKLNDLEVQSSQFDELIWLNSTDQKETLEVQKLENFIKEQTIKSKYEIPYSIKDIVKCNTGSHEFLNSSYKSDFNRFGVGVTLYFKWIKNFTVLFLILFLISLFSLSLIIQTYTNKDPELAYSFNIKQMFFMMSIGAIGKDDQPCQWNLNQNFTQDFQINLKCNVGKLAEYTPFIGIINQENNQNNCESINPIFDQLDNSCLNIQELQAQYIQKCIDQQECQINFDKSYFTCDKKNQTFYMSSYCDGYTIQEQVTGIEMDKYQIVTLIGLIDFLITLVFILNFLNLQESQKIAISNIREKSLSPSMYSIQVTNLPQIDQKTLIKDLWFEMENILNTNVKKENLKFFIIDIQIFKDLSLVNWETQKMKLKENRNQKVNQWVNEYNSENTLRSITINDLKKLNINKVQANLELLEIIKIDKQIQYLQNKINNYQENKNFKDATAFITFNTQKQKKHALRYFQRSQLSQLLQIIFPYFYKNDNYKIKNKLIYVTDAPDPDNIIWENFNLYSGFMKAFISLIGFIISICLPILILTLAERGGQNVNNTDKYDICQTLQPTQIEAIDAYRQDFDNMQFQCFCLNNEYNFDILTQVFPDVDERICAYWYVQYQVKSFISVLVYTFVILLLNQLQIYLSQFLVRLEMHKSIAMQNVSLISKTYTFQFLNSIGILIIVFQRISGLKNLDYFFNGQQYDIDEDWIREAGFVITLTMIINLFRYPFQYILQKIQKIIRQLWDQKCRCNKRYTQQKTQAEYNQVYQLQSFKFEEGYGQQLSLLLICLIISPIVPIIYFITFIALFTIYWADKFLFLKYSKNPKNLDEKMEQYALTPINYFIIFHIMVSMWVLGNDRIFFSDNDAFQSLKEYSLELIQQSKKLLINNQTVEIYIQQIFYRIVQDQNIPNLILLIFIILYSIAQNFFLTPFKALKSFISKQLGVNDMILKVKSSARKLTFYNLLTTQQIEQEKKILRFEINKEKQQQNPNQDYLKILKRKVDMIQQYQKIVKKQQKICFNSQFSYNIKHNKTYAKSMNIEQEIAILNQI